MFVYVCSNLVYCKVFFIIIHVYTAVEHHGIGNGQVIKNFLEQHELLCISPACLLNVHGGYESYLFECLKKMYYISMHYNDGCFCIKYHYIVSCIYINFI